MAQWQQLLDELRAAKACLTDPAAKAAYDAELTRRLLAGSANPPPAPGVTPPMPQSPQMALPPGLAPSPPTFPPPPATPSPAAPYTPPAALYVPPAAPYTPPAAPYTPPPPNMVGGPSVAPYSPNVPGQGSLANIPAAGPVPGALPIGMPAATPVATPAPAAQPSFGNPVSEAVVSVRTSQRPVRRKSSSAVILVQVALVVVILVGAGVAFKLYQERQREAVAARTAANNGKPRSTASDPTPPASDPKTPPTDRNGKSGDKPKPTRSEPSTPAVQAAVQAQETPKSASTSEPAKPETPPKVEPAKPETPPVDPQKQKALSQALADARASLTEYDLKAARNFLETAEKHVQGPDDKAQVERLKSLTDNVGEFWKTMSQIIGRLEAMEEIPIGDDMVVVVDVNAKQLTIKVRGQVREYSPYDRIPHVLVAALADRQFGKDPQSKAIYASYLTVAPKGDRQRARQLFEEAIAAGVNVSYLLPELDLAAPTAGRPVVKRSAPPTDQATLKQAEQAVRTRFRADFEQATSPAEKAQLAKKLLHAGEAAAAEPDTAFVMLREARDLAIAASDAELVCKAIDELARFVEVDPLVMKVAALEEVAKSTRGVNGCKELVQNTLPLIEEAVSAGRQQEVNRLANLATAAAQKSKSTSLVKQVRAVTQELEASRKGKKPE